MTSDPVSVRIPAHLHRRIVNRLDRAGFEAVDEYVVYVLEEVLAEVEASTPEDDSQVDEDEIQRRLQSLGYLES